MKKEEEKLTCPKQYNNPIDPPNLDPSTCDSKKYTPPLSTLHLSQIPTAESTLTNATHTEK